MSLISLRRVVEFRRCIVRSRLDLLREARPNLLWAFLHPMLSPPSKTFFM